eukprot:1631103-Rhodomonas_salina.1
MDSSRTSRTSMHAMHNGTCFAIVIFFITLLFGSSIESDASSVPALLTNQSTGAPQFLLSPTARARTFIICLTIVPGVPLPGLHPIPPHPPDAANWQLSRGRSSGASTDAYPKDTV